MTLQQQAYRLIDSLSDDSVRAIIQVMRRMVPEAREENYAQTADMPSQKLRAYQRMRQLRRETAQYEFSEAQRGAALEDKFGSLG